MKISIDLSSLTDVVAWVGAIVAVASLIWQIATWRKMTHRVKVSRSTAYLIGEPSGVDRPMLQVTAKNIGTMSVTIQSWGVSAGKKQGNFVPIKQIYPSETLPHQLVPGSAASFFLPRHEVEAYASEQGVAEDQLRCWVRLAIGKEVFAAEKGI
ncbi:MAG: hypothetical protein ACNYNX_08385 [Leucobacter sp.]